MKTNLKDYLTKLVRIDKKDSNFLKDYHESSLIMVKEFLQDINTIFTIKEVIKAIENELSRRKKITEDFVNNLKEKYLGKYICYNLRDGLGSYIILKVSDIKKTHKEYCDLCYSIGISNVDGCYSINNYKSGSIKLYSDINEKDIEVITEERYKEEFEKAIEYYKSLME